MEEPKVEPKEEHEHKKEDKTYIKSKKKWKDFQLHEDLIAALADDGKTTPTRVQSETLDITVNPDRKKFNVLIRAANGSGKTMSFLVPILNSIQGGLSTAEDKNLYLFSYSAKERSKSIRFLNLKA
jgi:superfamily II DNA/RNA helicase